MPPSFDCVLINGTLVNHDGIGLRDIGVRDGRIVEIGSHAELIARDSQYAALHRLQFRETAMESPPR